MLYSCGLGLLHSCFVCFITYSNQPTSASLILPLQGYSGSTSGPGGAPMPPPGSMYSGAPGSSGAKPPTSGGPPGPPASKEAPPGGPGAHPAQRPPSGFPGPYGGPPGPRPPGPMYPGESKRSPHLATVEDAAAEKGSSVGGGEYPAASAQAAQGKGRSTPSRLRAFRTHPINTNLV